MHAWLFVTAMLVAPPSGHEGVISGQVVHHETHAPLPGALVVLQCSCLRAIRETQTGNDGLYAFRGLPAGTYTVQVIVGQVDVVKVITLPPSATKSEPSALEPGAAPRPNAWPDAWPDAWTDAWPWGSPFA